MLGSLRVMGFLDRWDSRNAEVARETNKLKTYDDLNAALRKGTWGRVNTAIWTAQVLRICLVIAVAALGLIVWAIRSIL